MKYAILLFGIVFVFVEICVGKSWNKMFNELEVVKCELKQLRKEIESTAEKGVAE